MRFDPHVFRQIFRLAHCVPSYVQNCLGNSQALRGGDAPRAFHFTRMNHRTRAALCVQVFVLLSFGATAALGQQSSVGSASSYIDRGNGFFAPGDFGRAISDYNTALAFEPHCANAYFNRAGALRVLGHLDEALADYNRAIELAPRLSEAYGYRAIVKFLKGDVEGA